MFKLSSLVLVSALAWEARAQTNLSFRFQSGPERTALLELYTSEGCSSCPPAESWLSQLQNSPRLWRDYAPAAFHVDYWNYLGWRDAWSDATYSQRQRAYAQGWGTEEIYTPELVLNGREWHNWFSGRSGPKSTGENAGTLTLISTDRKEWQALFAPEKPAAEPYEIHVALLAGGISSDVKAGENQGRRLTHDFAVTSLVSLGMTTSHGVARGKFVLDTTRSYAGKTLALSAWVTRAGTLEPLQATGGWLIPPASSR